MRVVSSHSRRESDMDSTMTPMIDVVFLLLVFFVWTSSFQAIEALLPSRLAAETGGATTAPLTLDPEMDFDQVVIGVDYRDQTVAWRINDVSTATIDQLRLALDQIHALQPEAPIIVHPSDETPLAFVIQAYDLARVAGFAKVSLAAELQ